jgi:hypothetical protein
MLFLLRGVKPTLGLPAPRVIARESTAAPGTRR